MRAGWTALGCTALLVLAGCAAPPQRETAAAGTLAERDRRLLDETFATLAPQRPGIADLYVVGFAGDGHEDVFRNEVHYLGDLMSRRFGARGRVVALVNHPDSLGPAPRPLATLDTLRDTLARLGRVMDRDEDLLLLYMTMHGTQDHQLVLQLQPVVEQSIDPRQLRAALDGSGIRNRVVVVSACYAGGFIPALQERSTLVIAAARADRTSFGCGTESAATYFGRAWLVEGLNRTTDFIEAFHSATGSIAAMELAEAVPPSFPQIEIGAAIPPRLDAWRAGLLPGPPVPYPYDEPGVDP
jgi:hypothetical protein